MKHSFYLSLCALVLFACGESKNDAAPPSEKPSLTDTAPGNLAKPCGLGLHISPSAAVVTINGVDIPCSELIARSEIALKHADLEFQEKVRELQQEALATLIDEHLLNLEMKGSNQSIEKFIGTRIQVSPASNEELQSFYRQAVASGQALPPLEEIQSELADFLNEQKQKSALNEYRSSLFKKAEVEVKMPIFLPPVFDVHPEGNEKGSSSAKVTIVEFSDFDCVFCAQAEPTIEKLLEKYGSNIRFVYRDLPLPIHPNAPKAAEASHCAQKQGKYWQMHAKLFQSQQQLGIEKLKLYAGELGLEQSAFDSCLDSGETQSIVAASLEEGSRLGINGTPAFFINGRLLTGAQPYERFAELIDHELAQ